MSSLYEQLGGEAAIQAAVDKFYAKVLADDRIKHFFDQTDMVKQHEHQKKFLTFALGGPNQYSGRSMRAAHKHLVHEQGLDDSHFDAVAENLKATLEELGVGADQIGEVLTKVGGLRNEVLDR